MKVGNDGHDEWWASCLCLTANETVARKPSLAPRRGLGFLARASASPDSLGSGNGCNSTSILEDIT